MKIRSLIHTKVGIHRFYEIEILAWISASGGVLGVVFRGMLYVMFLSYERLILTPNHVFLAIERQNRSRL
jgi:hypothetical protein